MSCDRGPATPERHYHQALSDDHARRTKGTIPELWRETTQEELSAVRLLDALDTDERPSFAIQAQLGQSWDDDTPLDLVYWNAAFTNSDGLRAKVTGRYAQDSVFIEHGATQKAFRKWLRGVGDGNDFARRGNAYIFDGLIWTATTAESYKILSGLHVSLFLPDVSPKNMGEPLGSPKNMPVQGRAPLVPPSSTITESSCPGQDTLSPRPKHGPYDLTSLEPPQRLLSEHMEFFRNVDWAKTPLGPMTAWPPELRIAVNVCLNDLQPCVLFWGPDFVMIYNEPYIQLLGVMHPTAMGASARVVASQYWHTFQPLIDHIDATGNAVRDIEIPIFIDRHGFLEETYWSFEFIPVLDNDGYIAGYSHPLFEATKHKLLERRVSSLVELSSQTAKATTLQSYWDLALHTLTLQDKDVPLALLYAAETSLNSDFGSVSSPGSIPLIENYQLKGTIGVHHGHTIAPHAINIQCEGSGLQPLLARAAKSRKATVVQFEELCLTDRELKDINWKGYSEPCRTIVICPLLPTTGEQVEGFLIFGTNPRRPFDEDYQQFLHVMLRLLATSWASVALFEEEVRQKEKAMVRAAQLQEQLLAEMQMKETRFQRFAERADVAIFITDAAGRYTYRNQRWYEVFKPAADELDAHGAMLQVAFPEDVARCEGYLGKLILTKEPVIFELKTKMPWQPPAELSSPETDSTEHFHWILCSAYPEIGHDGELVEIVGNVTDISRQKWGEGVQKTRTESAMESKRHLEHFIDTTSHEMRNPLSAIMQSADGILCSYSPRGVVPPSPNAWSASLEQIMDAAQTIAQCAQHMRHIIDDILTISKLDSGLLVITPVDAQPESVANHAVKMFEAEARAASVDLKFIVDQSYRDLDVDWVSLDPTRILQVYRMDLPLSSCSALQDPTSRTYLVVLALTGQILINLLTNAIKFTRLEQTRYVTVKLSASREQPESQLGGTQFIEEKLVDNDRRLEDDWREHDDLFYIQFCVNDTGRGLTEDERGSLFTRFSQASPRTHIHYGGSGLGLFISRRLTELQGGAIGLASESKKGSTFSFYVKTRRIMPTMVRRGSVPRVLPEDLRHRPSNPLLNMSRPSPPVRIPSHRTDDGRWSTPPSPRLLRQVPLHQRSSTFMQADSPSEARELPLSDGEALQQKVVPATLHVLVVEDNLVNQRVLAKQLRNSGCVVSVANHGREAVDYLEKTIHWNRDHAQSYPTSRRPSCHIPCTEPPPPSHCDELEAIDLSVILMDWEMPIMNGLEAVAQIRRLEADGWLKGRIPVIGVTANVRQQQIETAMTAGMDDVVGKPFRVSELLPRMRGIIEKVVYGQIDSGVAGLDITDGESSAQ
ncbi:putative histidine kinase HHK11p [Setomelanomma holmii]|uniref:Histidine kinase HHK11p n=1 Tax=Setomelanomma holmii TaxID=210430 RepID=A0A9P4LHW3_9PLEO|nr:putative histidine kinase HHK11p [Setomelanomma holmii]